MFATASETNNLHKQITNLNNNIMEYKVEVTYKVTTIVKVNATSETNAIDAAIGWLQDSTTLDELYADEGGECDARIL